MIAVRELDPGVFTLATTDIVESLDGKRRAPVATLVGGGFTDEDRAEFGIYLVEPSPVQEGQRLVGSAFQRVDGVVVQVLDVEPWDPVPAVVSRRQMKLALNAAGKLDDVEAFVAASNDRAVNISWEDATEFHRCDAMINAMAPLVGFNSEDLDNLFRNAAAIP